jgi:hypothetical protein
MFAYQDWVVALSHAWPLTTLITTPKFIVGIVAHVGQHITFHLMFHTEY